MKPRLKNPELYTVAWIAALPIERAAATALLDESHDQPDGFTQHQADANSYSWGRVGEHNIVIASLAAGVYGTTSAATTVSDLIHSLPHIRIGLLVGIGGGIAQPDEDQDIRLGDVVVSQPDGTTGGVVQYDLGKAKANGIWEQKGSLDKPPPVLLHALASLQARHEMMPSKIPDLLEAMLQAHPHMAKGKNAYTYPGAENDRLFESQHSHVGGRTCAKCDPAWELEREERESTDPEIHYGIIASGNILIKDSATRDSLFQDSGHQYLCVEMEAAGLMDRFPCLVIRGICDYADSHKNDRWQRYAAATAAAFAVELLGYVPARQVQATQKVIEAVQSLEQKVNGLSVSIQNVDSNITIDRLPVAEGASFDSHAEEHNPTCLVNTRVDLLREISHWIEDDDSKPIFWLNGMAGTGKSTIARTVAQQVSECGNLGASFFFKKGETDRGSLIKFVPTLARQLARSISGFAPFVKNAIDDDPQIVGKAVGKQFSELITRPLVELAETTTLTSPLAIIIDALDECEREDEIRSLIDIFSHASSTQYRLRIFITSRPDLPIRLGFAQANDTYRTVVLHNMPADTIEHDILVFLVNAFEKIRVDFNTTVPEQLNLPLDWPGADTTNKLTKMAVPLFIFAATACRFIGDYKIDSPSEQLHKYLQLSTGSYGSHLGQTYGPVLRSMVADVSKEDAKRIIEQFCHVVGSIVILASPLSVIAVSRLLGVNVNVVHTRLNALHSVLDIPPRLHEPVRLLHISFRDYLTDPNQNQTNEFWVDRQRTHLGLFKNCLRVMDGILKEDICNLIWPGTKPAEVSPEQVASCISEELQYACRYWVYHLQKSEKPLLNNEEVFAFLKKHLLHWLEALSLIGRFRESFQAIRILQTITKNEQNKMLGQFLREVHSFLQTNSTVIDLHPLQLYSSLLCSMPSGSRLNSMFSTRFPQWVRKAPEPSKTSEQAQYILEGHESTIGHCCFSSDNSRLGSYSDDGTIRIWQLDTGECIRVITCEGRELDWWRPFKLSYDALWVVACGGGKGKTFNSDYAESNASGEDTESDANSDDTELDANSDDTESDANSDDAESDANSDDAESDASSDDAESDDRNDEAEPDVSDDEDEFEPGFLNLWRGDTGDFMGEFPLFQSHTQTFQFSQNYKLLAFLKDRDTAVVLRLDVAEAPQEICLTHSEMITGGASYRRFREQGSAPYFIEFSTDSSMLVIMSGFTGEYAVWETETFACIRYQKISPFFRAFIRPGSLKHAPASIAITGDASIMVAGALSEDSWPFEIGEYGPTGDNNGQLEIRWLDSEVVICSPDCHGHVMRTQFSADHTVLATIRRDGSIRTWRVETGECLTLFESGEEWRTIALSPDFSLLSSTGRTRTISVWTNKAGETDLESPKRSDPIESVVLSSDQTLAASSSHYGVVRVWDINKYHCIHQFLDGFEKRGSADYGSPEIFQFTSDNRYLCVSRTTFIYRSDSGYDNTIPFLNGQFQVWDIRTGQRVTSSQTKIHSTSLYLHQVYAVSVAPNDHWIGLVSDRHVKILEVGTFSVTSQLTFDGPVYGVTFSPDSRLFVVLSSWTHETITDAWGRKFERQKFVASIFSTVQADNIGMIELSGNVSRILAISSDSKFLALHVYDGKDTRVQAMLIRTGELICDFRASPRISDFSFTQNDSVFLFREGRYFMFRNSLSGQLIRRLIVDLNFSPGRLSFDANTQQLHTNLGTMNTYGQLVGGDDHAVFANEHLLGYGLNDDRSWLLWNNKKVFWLPPAFRPYENAVEVSGSTIIIGTQAGRVIFFEFDIENLSRTE